MIAALREKGFDACGMFVTSLKSSGEIAQGNIFAWPRSVVTRSGSNEWHGSAFEFIRNNYIDATNFFSTSKDTLHQNQYGGTFGRGRVRRPGDLVP